MRNYLSSLSIFPIFLAHKRRAAGNLALVRSTIIAFTRRRLRVLRRSLRLARTLLRVGGLPVLIRVPSHTTVEILALSLPLSLLDGIHFEQGPVPIGKFPHVMSARAWLIGQEDNCGYLEYKKAQHGVSNVEAGEYLAKFKQLALTEFVRRSLWNPILVRPSRENRFLVVDGLHRVSIRLAMQTRKGRTAAWIRLKLS